MFGLLKFSCYYMIRYRLMTLKKGGNLIFKTSKLSIFIRKTVCQLKGDGYAKVTKGLQHSLR